MQSVGYMANLLKNLLQVVAIGDISLDEPPVAGKSLSIIISIYTNHQPTRLVELLHGRPTDTSGGASDQDNVW